MPGVNRFRAGQRQDNALDDEGGAFRAHVNIVGLDDKRPAHLERQAALLQFPPPSQGCPVAKTAPLTAMCEKLFYTWWITITNHANQVLFT